MRPTNKIKSIVYGRDDSFKQLDQAYKSKKSELVVVYGRRRVGKSTLVENFTQLEKKHCLLFEGLERLPTNEQVAHFTDQLKSQIHDQLLQKAHFSNWSEVFDYLTNHLSKQEKKVIIFFDEFQWMAAGQSKLVSLIKFYWDNHWLKLNVMMILCGSIASFMVKNVLRSKALYGRITLQMRLTKLDLSAAHQIIGTRRSKWEALKYLMILGGVPKYLKDISPSKSFEQNISNLFFSSSALYQDEFAKIFNVHFKAPATYLKIVKILDRNAMTLEEISNKMKLKSSGGVKAYLSNLELAEFVRSYIPFDKDSKSSMIKYRLADEFLIFYIKFVMPHMRTIEHGGGELLFENKILKEWRPWLGFAFENFCQNHALFFAKHMGFLQKVESFGPYFQKSSPGFQLDLVYKRTDDTITCCEIKFSDHPIGVEVVGQMNRKLALLNVSKKVTIEKALIAPFGADDSLLKLGHFDHIITIDHF